jgi:hypothetical protein
VDIGGTGAAVTLFIRDFGNNQALWFNTAVSGLYVGGSGSGGEMWLRDTAGQVTLQNDSTGDLILGGGTSDGDLTMREGTTGIATISADGNTATLTVGAQGVAGDPGQIYLRDADGVTNNIWLRGITADINLGSTVSSEDGDISLSDGSSNDLALDLEGSNGTITNKITGNGVVKAWARMNADGTVASCYRCNSSATVTGKISTGNYEVDFTIDSNIDTRPVACSNGHNGVGFAGGVGIYCVGRGGDDSAVFVHIETGAGSSTDSPFTVVVF